MESTVEQIQAYRMARWRLKCATIAVAMARGWPLADDVDTEHYRECLARLEEARAEVAAFPAEWSRMEEEPTQPPETPVPPSSSDASQELRSS
ncbi:hypothetical protein DES53_10831 [Roseimicrobium gellanilyticum]|uniref:Uncharacterized protein n=1 Tax=Roseimicrobium gellanilyticum TaxID=748857 RepID=A0A366HER8_9BACT|nr:hypothetical protein [Roseimicrobium gellanilyticum]RBP40325.1 hypothetical protein DES53_10831 [Roseimicrobium gellanilyticum]